MLEDLLIFIVNLLKEQLKMQKNLSKIQKDKKTRKTFKKKENNFF